MQVIPCFGLLGAILAVSCVHPGGNTDRSTGAALAVRAKQAPQSTSAPWNFVSDSADDQLFRRELERLAVVPVAAEYTRGSGIRLNTTAQELLVLTQAGIKVVLRQSAGISLPAARSEGPPFSRVLFQPLHTDDPFDLALVLREEPVEQVLAFTARSGLQLGSITPCEIPSDVALRDSPRTAPGTSSFGNCFRTPSRRFVLATYEGRGTDNREAWLTVNVYDDTWKILGRAGRSPNRWPDGASSWLTEFAMVGIFEDFGMYSPVFVTLDACQGFVLNTFLSNGHLAQMTVPFTLPADIVVVGCAR